MQYIGPDGVAIEGPVLAPFLSIPTPIHCGVQDGLEAWYGCGGPLTGSFINQGGVLDTLIAVGLLINRNGTIDNVGIRIGTAGGAGSKIRFGLYEAKGLTNLYPGNLVFDSGEFDGTIIGLKTVPVNIRQTMGRFLWGVTVMGTAAPSVYQNGNNSSTPFGGIGVGPALNAVSESAITVAFPYAPLPAQFPAGGIRQNAGCKPMVSVRYIS